VRRARLLTAVTVTAAVVTGCGTGDDDASAGDGEGTPFSLVAMAHTFADTSRAWDGAGDDGTFTYVAAPCSFDAPVNNNATNLGTLNARLPGTSSPASTRMQPLEFEVTSGEDGAGELEGTMSMTVCHTEKGPTAEDDPVPDREKERIVFGWSAEYEKTSEEEVVFVGSFDIDEGTGAYEGMSGSGRLSGYFTCAFGTPEGCADVGEFTDLQLVMMGTYQHPDH
jgi:hypothetical protein